MQREMDFLNKLLKGKNNRGGIEILCGFRINDQEVIIRRRLKEYYCELDNEAKIIIIKKTKDEVMAEFEMPMDFILNGSVIFDDEVILSLQYKRKDIHMKIIIHTVNFPM